MQLRLSKVSAARPAAGARAMRVAPVRPVLARAQPVSAGAGYSGWRCSAGVACCLGNSLGSALPLRASARRDARQCGALGRASACIGVPRLTIALAGRPPTGEGAAGGHQGGRAGLRRWCRRRVRRCLGQREWGGCSAAFWGRGSAQGRRVAAWSPDLREHTATSRPLPRPATQVEEISAAISHKKQSDVSRGQGQAALRRGARRLLSLARRCSAAVPRIHADDRA